MRGRGFASGMVVTFGGRQVDPADLTIIDSRRAVVTPPGDPGSADVAVTSQGASATQASAFTYEALYVDPPTGSIAGGTYVHIEGRGTNFQPTDVITFGGQTMTSFTVVSDHEIAGYTPAGIAGQVIVTVGAQRAGRSPTRTRPTRSSAGSAAADRDHANAQRHGRERVHV